MKHERKTTEPVFLRPADVASLLNVGRTKIFLLERDDPTFPKKIRFSARCVGWRRVDLERWLQEKAKQSEGV